MYSLLPDTPETLKRRRAMLLGLRSLFNTEQSLIALCIWERDFADTASAFIGVHTYAKNICSHFGRSDLRRELHAALLDALFQNDDKLPPDPTPAMRQIAANIFATLPTEATSAQAAIQSHTQMPVHERRAHVRSPAPTAAAPPAPPPQPKIVAPALNTTLCLLLKHLLAGLSEADPRAPHACVSALENLIHPIRLPSSTSIDLMSFMKHPDEQTILSQINVAQAAHVVHVLYVWMAEAVGPEMADKLLAQAIGQVEHEPQAKGFGVRQLL